MKLNLYPYDMSSDYSNFDWLLFGSDQIWSSRLTGGRFDPVFFGQGVNCRKATYAASMSPICLDAAEKKVLPSLLRDFNAISVNWQRHSIPLQARRCMWCAIQYCY